MYSRHVALFVLSLNKYGISGPIYVGFVLMENLREQLRATGIPDQSQSPAINGCNLLDSSLEKVLSIDEIKASICSDRRKKPGKRLVQTTSYLLHWVTLIG